MDNRSAAAAIEHSNRRVHVDRHLLTGQAVRAHAAREVDGLTSVGAREIVDGCAGGARGIADVDERCCTREVARVEMRLGRHPPQVVVLCCPPKVDIAADGALDILVCAGGPPQAIDAVGEAKALRVAFKRCRRIIRRR